MTIFVDSQPSALLTVTSNPAVYGTTASASGTSLASTPLSVSTAANHHSTTAAQLPTLTTVTAAAPPAAASSCVGAGVGVGTGGVLPHASFSQYHLSSMTVIDYPPQQQQPSTGGVSGAQLNKALTISSQVSLVFEVHDWWSEQVVGGAGQTGAVAAGSSPGAGGHSGGGLIMGGIGSFMQDDDDFDDY